MARGGDFNISTCKEAENLFSDYISKILSICLMSINLVCA